MSRSTGRHEGGEVALIAEILRGMPNFEGAACVGSAGLFDGRERDETAEQAAYRHKAAEQLCQRCPALNACHAWSSTQPVLQEHVIAALVPTRNHDQKEIA